jgi:hypothetical protein
MKRLKLGRLLPTLPERVAYARKAKLTELDFLELALHDEVARRDEKNLAGRLLRAGFDCEQTLEGFDWDAPISFDRDRVRDLFTLGFVERQEDVIFVGPVGVRIGKISGQRRIRFPPPTATRGGWPRPESIDPDPWRGRARPCRRGECERPA